MAKRHLTIGEYLSHMGKAILAANVTAIKETRDLIASNELDAKIPIGDHMVTMDGVSLNPEGWHRLDEMEIVCESAVHVVHDKEGEPSGLALSMTKGLFNRGMHVKFRAKFTRGGTVEALEILRDAGNDALRQELVRLNIEVKSNKDGD